VAATTDAVGEGGAGPAGRVEFEVDDASGTVLDFAAVRRVQSNGAGEDGEDDALLDAHDLGVLVPWPMQAGGPSFAVDRPAGDVTLSLAWPTSAGYQQLLVDLPPPGRYVFTTVAAAQAVAEAQRQLARRPAYRPSAAVTQALTDAQALLTRAAGLGSTSAQGALGAQALDAAVRAQLLLQAESGRVAAATGAVGSGAPVLGVTFDDPARHDALPAVSALAATAGRPGWVRLVFDPQRGAASYAADVAAVRAAGLHVLGQFVDSSELAGVDVATWRARVVDYVATLPQVEEWEVGNEVNGEFAGPDAAAKTLWAARYVKQHSPARTLVTLYWQLGEGEPSESVFTWARENLPAAAAGDVDDLGLSVYPQDHPLGASLDRVVDTLHRTYPAQRVLITELGYGSPDLQGPWWFGSATDVDAGRLAVARFYSDAVQALPGTGGGTFWWYFLQQALPPSPLYAALTVQGPPAVGRGARAVRWSRRR